jgi:hypothetical protein
MDLDRAVVKVAAVRLELGDQGDEEAAIVQLHAPPTPRAGASCGSVEAFELVEAREPDGLPLSEGVRCHDGRSTRRPPPRR